VSAVRRDPSRKPREVAPPFFLQRLQTNLRYASSLKWPTRFEADVLSVIADILTQAGTATRWERHGISAQELALHLLDTSAGVKSATGNLSDYKQRMALAIRIIVKGANGRKT